MSRETQIRLGSGTARSAAEISTDALTCTATKAADLRCSSLDVALLGKLNGTGTRTSIVTDEKRQERSNHVKAEATRHGSK